MKPEKTVIAGYPVNCEDILVGYMYEPLTLDPVWLVKHCQKSRYCLKIVQCQDESCCSPSEKTGLKLFLIVSYSFHSFTNTLTMVTHQLNHKLER